MHRIMLHKKNPSTQASPYSGLSIDLCYVVSSPYHRRGLASWQEYSSSSLIYLSRYG